MEDNMKKSGKTLISVLLVAVLLLVISTTALAQSEIAESDDALSQNEIENAEGQAQDTDLNTPESDIFEPIALAAEPVAEQADADDEQAEAEPREQSLEDVGTEDAEDETVPQNEDGIEPLADAAQSPFEINEDGVITGFNPELAGTSDIIIPNEINGIKVTAIGDAFRGSTFITSVFIPVGVISLDDGAFHGCENLTSISLPNGIINLGEGTFISCDNLKSITVPGSVKLTDAFSKSGIENIVLEAGITEIPEKCFMKAYNLSSISIPDTVTYIGDRALAITSLTEVTIPASVTYLGNAVFHGDSELQWVHFLGNAPEGGTTIDDPEDTKYSFNPNYVTLYNPGAQGFTNPWRGWPTQMIGEQPAQPSDTDETTQPVVTDTNAQTQTNLTVASPTTGATSTESITKLGKSPKTGDETEIAFYIVLLAIAAGVATFIVGKRIKERG